MNINYKINKEIIFVGDMITYVKIPNIAINKS